MTRLLGNKPILGNDPVLGIHSDSFGLFPGDNDHDNRKPAPLSLKKRLLTRSDETCEICFGQKIPLRLSLTGTEPNKTRITVAHTRSKYRNMTDEKHTVAAHSDCNNDMRTLDLSRYLQLKGWLNRFEKHLTETGNSIDSFLRSNLIIPPRNHKTSNGQRRKSSIRKS